RMKHSPVVHETRCEVRDPDAAALGVRQRRRDDRGVAVVVALGPDLVLQNDIRVPLVLVAGEKAGEYRIAVEARKAPPDDPRVGVAQGRNAPVADETDVETRCAHVVHSSRARPANHSRTSEAVAKPTTAPGRGCPTAIPTPFHFGKTAKAASSVTSSPMNTGRRPAQGARAMNSARAVPLLNFACLISSTHLPGTIVSSSPRWADTAASTTSRTRSAAAGAWRKWTAIAMVLSSTMTPGRAASGARSHRTPLGIG